MRKPPWQESVARRRAVRWAMLHGFIRPSSDSRTLYYQVVVNVEMSTSPISRRPWVIFAEGTNKATVKDVVVDLAAQLGWQSEKGWCWL